MGEAVGRRATVGALPQSISGGRKDHTMKLHKNSVALVTGAARGLGWGIARAFGIAGARVGGADIREDELGRCARDLAAAGGNFQPFRSDLPELAACTGLRV